MKTPIYHLMSRHQEVISNLICHSAIGGMFLTPASELAVTVVCTVQGVTVMANAAVQATACVSGFSAGLEGPQLERR